jgi:CHAT domain-containing protein
MSLLKICTLVSICLMLSGNISAQTPQQSVKPTPEVQTLIDQARTARDANKFDELESLAKQALEKARAAGDKAGEATALLLQSDGLRRGREYEKGLELAQQSLTISKGLMDKNGEAVALLSIGRFHYFMNKPLEALAPFEQAAVLFREIGDRYDEAGCLMNAGIIYENTGQSKKALTIYDKVLPIFREVKNKRSEANTLTNMALAYGKLDEPRKSAAAAKQALALYRELDSLPDIANALILVAQNEVATGSIEQTLKLLDEALAAAQQAKSLHYEASVYSQKGVIYMNLSRNELAMDYFHRSLVIKKQTGALSQQSHTLTNLGILHSRMGEPNKAQQYFEQALAIHRQLSDKNAIATSLLNLGYLNNDLRRYDQAESYFRDALPLAKAVESPSLIASSLGGLAGVARKRKQYSVALQHYRRAIELYQSLNDTQHMAALWGNLGIVHFDMQDYRQAEAAQRKALDLFRKAKDEHGVSNTLFALTEIEQQTKHNPKKMEQMLRQSLEAGKKANNRIYTANALHGLASLDIQRGRLAQAEAHSRQAINLVEEVRTGIGEAGEGKAEFLSANLYFYFEHLDILLRRGKTKEAFEFAQMTKARTLLDTLTNGRVDLSSVLTPEEKQQEEALRLKADSLNQQIVREGVENEVGAKQRTAALKAQLKQTERDIKVFTETLYARHPGLTQRRVAQTATLAEIGKILPADTALLDFVAVSKTEWCVFVVTVRQGKPQVRAVRLNVPYEKLAKQAAAFRKACGDPRQPWKAQARGLYAILIRPLESALQGKKRLIVCPDGALWDVPFAALLKGDTPLWSRYALSYAYSATGWQAARTLTRERQRAQALKSLLVCANPDFGTSKRFGGLAELPGQRPLSEPSRRFSSPTRPISEPSRPLAEPSRSVASRIASTVPTRGGVIVSLAGTRREADSLKRLFPDATLLTETAAQEVDLKKQVGQYRYLHLATHGFLNDAAPMLSSVVLAVPAEGSKDDGFLTAREIYELNLGAELTVLSACNTGRGEARSGEGIVGLTWALLCAGCPSQVVSQWSVDDAATAQLMTGFYRGLKTGTDKAESLRKSSLTLRRNNKLSHPYYWAAFVLMGD